MLACPEHVFIPCERAATSDSSGVAISKHRRYDSRMWLVTPLTRKVDYLEHFSVTMLIVKWSKVTRNKSAFNSLTIS